MHTLGTAFGKITSRRILVAGDFLLDRYSFGVSQRISPEAPVPVVVVQQEEDRLGGAGNVVQNLVALGMQPVIFGRVGNDASAEVIRARCADLGVNPETLLVDDACTTPLKKRIIASGQQVVRVDYERTQEMSSACEERALAQIPNLVQSVDLVAISDYAKGFLTDRVIRALIDEARKQSVPVICDPKDALLSKYSRATVLKPNFSEAVIASKLSSQAPIQSIVREIFQSVSVDVLMITRSEQGISLFFADGREELHPVQVKEVRDVTGAGDTVLAMLATAMANGVDVSVGTQLANIAASLVVEHVGCAVVSMADIAKRYAQYCSQGKIFSSGCSIFQHIFHDKNTTHLQLGAIQSITMSVLQEIKAAKQESLELIVSIERTEAAEEIAEILASFVDVDYVLIQDVDMCNAAVE